MDEDLIRGDQEVLNLLVEERARQYMKWGDQKHTPDEWRAIFDEEFAEFKCKQVCGYRAEEQLKELIEAAAVLCAWAKQINNGRNDGTDRQEGRDVQGSRGLG